MYNGHKLVNLTYTKGSLYVAKVLNTLDELAPNEHKMNFLQKTLRLGKGLKGKRKWGKMTTSTREENCGSLVNLGPKSFLFF